jgi:hypothetical protein
MDEFFVTHPSSWEESGFHKAKKEPSQKSTSKTVISHKSHIGNRNEINYPLVIPGVTISSKNSQNRLT